MVSPGMVLPGIASHCPFFQSWTPFSAGWLISPGVSCPRGLDTTSLTGFGKCFLASSVNFLLMNLKASQSLFDSQFGGTAAPMGCMNEWRSVVFMSSFSYQWAAGSTMSQYVGGVFILLFRLSHRSLF